MIVYRYDPRIFAIGEIMEPDLNKSPDLTPPQKRVETIISKLWPEQAEIRKTALYTWADFEVFKDFLEWRDRGVSLLKNKYFYELEYHDDDFMTKGDLNHYTDAVENIHKPDLCRAALVSFVINFPYLLKPPKIEVLVKKAKVISIY